MTDLNLYITETDVSSDQQDGILSDEEVAVKDNICVKDIPTTCGSEMLENYSPPYNATVVEEILSEGASIPGKTNMDEFGMGTTTETSSFGVTKNPKNTDCVPGGSSGGSAAAVASGDVDMALGTDTGGSVRCPSAFCGVFGLKPTYGLVSRYGLVAYANSLEQIGPIADSTENLSKLLTAICGSDSRDHTTVETECEDYTRFADQPQSFTFGVPEQLTDGIEQNVERAFWNALDDLESEGFQYKMIDMPSLSTAVEAYYVIAMSEASSNLARFDGVRYGNRSDKGNDWNQNFSESRGEAFGEEVKRRVMLGTYATSEGYKDDYYQKAQQIRESIRSEFDSKFNEVDMVATPTMPVEPFKIGESLDDPLKMYLADANTTPVNLANLPAISVPTRQKSNLPVGLQIIGSSFSEPDLIRASSLIEDALD